MGKVSSWQESCSLCHVVDDRSEVGGTPELHGPDGLLVCLQNSWNSSTERTRWVSIL